MSIRTFPIYCKNGTYFHKIMDQETVMSVCNAPNELSITLTTFPQMNHHVYEGFLRDEFEIINEREFGYAKVQMQNDITRKIGSFKPKTTPK